jgi:hypothetical protein
MKLTSAQFAALRWLDERGGSGYIDGHGRVHAQGENLPQGCWKAWLFLVIRGCLSGGDNRLNITDYGRSHLRPNA